MPPPTSHSQLPATEIQGLYDIIDSTTPDRLHALLKSLTALSPANYDYIRSELMLRPGALKRARSGDRTEDSGQDEESDDSVEQNDAPSSRRRFKICMQCEKEYDVLQNDKKSCSWHDGGQEVDWDGDSWADHDEQCHGTIDTDEMRIEYPEGFVWSCCDEPGDADGCKISRHRPNRAKRVKS